MGFIRQLINDGRITADPSLADFYERKIGVWKQIYQGYYEPWHELKYRTLTGERKRRMSSMNAAKALCAELAGLTFNERCRISVTAAANTKKPGLESDEPELDIGGYINGVLEKNDFHTRLQEAIERAYATGGAAIKLWFENGEVIMGFVNAEDFIPISSGSGNIRNGIFVHRMFRKDTYYTLLEWHFWDEGVYVLRNELYKNSAADCLGKRTLLTELYPKLEEEIRIEGLKNPLFVYFKPNIANNQEDAQRYGLGVSIFANALDTLKALDICFDSFIREFVLGKKRIIVPSGAIRSVVDQNGEMRRYFDTSDEVYQALNCDDPAQLRISDNSVGLRVGEHIAAVNAFLSVLALQTGLTPGALAFDSERGMKTATEVISENSKTYKTVKSHENAVSDAICKLVDGIIELSQLYGELPELEYHRSVVFDDGIAEDMGSRITRALELTKNGLISRRRAMTEYLGYTPEEAEAEILQISKEQNFELSGDDKTND